MKKIRNIIFDLGRVILPISPQTTNDNFKSLGISNFEDIIVNLKAHHIFDGFEKGIVSTQEFIAFIKSESSEPITDEAILEAWNSMLLEFPTDRINLLHILAKEFNIYLLSNTNEIHYQYYTTHFEKEFGYTFNSIFKKAYYSQQIGHRKPETSIYEHILKDQYISPHECLFLDDVSTNLDAASSIGIHTQLITDEYTIIDFFGANAQNIKKGLLI